MKCPKCKGDTLVSEEAGMEYFTCKTPHCGVMYAKAKKFSFGVSD